MKGQQRIMATLDELVQQGKDMKAAIGNLATQVDRIPQAIDDLEARITAILAGGQTPENQAKIDEAFADAWDVVDAVTAATDKLRGAADDAADGTDEASTPPTP